VSVGSLNNQPVTEAQRVSLRTTINVSNTLELSAVGFSVLSLILAILYFWLTKKTDKAAGNKLIGLTIIVLILVGCVVLRNNILRQLLIDNQAI
ncbi:hypothetical protein BVY00_02380, partial [bacterium G20]